MKTKKELNRIKEEIEALGAELYELTDDELAQVVGGKEMQHQVGDDSDICLIGTFDAEVLPETNGSPK